MCGETDGKVRMMRNDKDEAVKKAFPGQAVKVTGFKSQAKAGNPLYTVNDPEVGKYISNKVKDRNDREVRTKKEAEIKEKMGDVTIGKLDKIEKRILHGGDKTLIYSRLGIVDREDVLKLKNKFGIKKELESITKEDIELSKLSGRTTDKQSRL